ncbi:MAG: response regulator transcription factor [Xanthomonadaceae bacterium]|nr:response regulator transcription factor [Xanthomonadaceae bacterium]
MIKVVIAEDEALLRHALKHALDEAWPELEMVIECEDGAEAIEAIAQYRPDAAFLDIRMPGLSGLDVAAAAAASSPETRVVFTTAYDQYAIAAFERGAIDYLLKPIQTERLAAAVQRIKARAPQTHPDAAALADLVRELARERMGRDAPLTWITANGGRETRLIMVDDVLYFHADNKYTVAVTAEGEALLRKPLRELLATLDPQAFRQIHRSTIVNLKAIASIVRDDSGRGSLRLKGRDETLAVSAPFMALFKAL